MGKVQHSHFTRSDTMRTWTVDDSMELYNVRNWGWPYFSINAEGNACVHAQGPDGPTVDLKQLADELQRRGIQLPILVRFSDILRARVEALNEAFRTAIQEYGYKGRYLGVYPIKVNQQRHVVEEIVRYGEPYQFGLEAGSKPELLAVLALLDSPEALIICNGYKDEEYVEMALLATKLGKNIIIVVEKFSEFQLIVDLARKLNVVPRIGVRAKLATRGSGRWESSGGDRSKFGLNVTELVSAIEFLRESEMLDCLELLHFHLGSQITNIRSVRDGLQEACRIFVEMHKLGANLRFLDVGGGLAVDYDGSRTNFVSSTNYSMQEYANDIVGAVLDTCDANEVPHPVIVSESGRAITAHHSVLLFNVLGTSAFGDVSVPPEIPEDVADPLANLFEVHKNITRKNFQEAYHDALHYRDECMSLFRHGFLPLKDRSLAETIFWSCLQKIARIVREAEYVPDDLEGLERSLADTYFCNFSCFQSLPDFWAVSQLFPIMPIHRLNTEPTRRAVLADITCDSDGKIDKFIDLRDVKHALELHPLNGEDYILGVFITGAYQEILGDMHNLFGDTNAVHVRIQPEGGYRIEHVVKGDTVEEVLRFVQYSAEDLLHRLRQNVEAAVRGGLISFEESRQFLEKYELGLEGYTYLERTD
ncbi:MAG TPA: biosynthetic arginine decarboxylase [Phycisphaerae bacterium]|jgi:arginine decarboxylase|nr:biosynthetic arginine decarboxylase [Phycisphaerae bacterium]HOB75258.1 biosynthetic arginine decarboxylase [Phycisphaerae bacterium]HOJ55066.1 biosynthetic arginine decarboxylase [Phycisphaerae bacterium]HOL24908.1 biosynthetic arginine decarboxylase [Phycisphaerae bacterium]HPP22864.1 biosynthetic arginine decarboxylase [Phycisphaerae bacterium]